MRMPLGRLPKHLLMVATVSILSLTGSCASVREPEGRMPSPPRFPQLIEQCAAQPDLPWCADE